MKKKILCIFCVTMLLAGCGTKTVYPDDYFDLKNERDQYKIKSESLEKELEKLKGKDLDNIAEETNEIKESSIQAEAEEINPDIPIGTEYTLGQGSYVVGEDIPAGRYRISYFDGNKYGGSFEGKGQYWDNFYIEPDYDSCYVLTDGDEFEISLATAKFEKIPSTPNEYFFKDGVYRFGSGRYYAGIDFPLGKYNITAIGGNNYGIDINISGETKYLDINESYNNAKFAKEWDHLDISLGYIEMVPLD